MNGPPLVIYGAMRRWSPQHFRATLQGYFLPASVLTMGGYWFTGVWTRAVTHDFLLALPAAIPAIFLGRFLNRRLHGDRFLKYVHAGLFCIGLILLVQAIRPAEAADVSPLSSSSGKFFVQIGYGIRLNQRDEVRQ